MEARLATTGYPQVSLGTICFFVFFIISCYAKPNSRSLRWLSSPPEAADHVIDAISGTVPRPPSRSANPTDLIPKVDGLSFVNDSPRTLRFYSASFRQQTTHELAWSAPEPRLSNPEGEFLDDKKYPDIAAVTSGEKYSIQGIVAGVSFVGGLAVSMSLCLLCCRIRQKWTSRMFDRRQQRNDSSSSAASTPDPKEVKAEP